MESLSRPLHRRKLSNVSSFSGKTAYDGVFSGHRQKYDGTPAVNVEEYREIFCSGDAGSSIPVLDLSGLEESCDGLDLEVRSIKPDYGEIFGGFRDQDIAISYDELVARDKARAPSSTSQSSQDPDDLSYESSDALKQFNLSYNKISKISKDGLDGTTHVTQLHAVPGFTCFVDESASESNKETVKQKSSSTNNVNANSSKPDFPEKQVIMNNINANSSKQGFPEKQTSQNSFDFGIHQEESLSDDITFKTFEANIKSHPSKVLSSSEYENEIKKQKTPATNNVPVSSPGASQPKKETEKQKYSVTNNVHSSEKVDLPEKQTSQIDVESQNRYGQDEPFSDDRSFKTFEADFKSYSSKVSSPPAASATNLDKHNDYQKRSNDESFSEDRNFKTFEANFKSYPSKVSSPPAASATNLDKRKNHQKRSNDESFSGDRNFKTFEAEFKSYSSKASSPPAASATNLDKRKNHQKRSNDESFSGDRNFKTFEADFKSYTSKASSPPAASATDLDKHKNHQNRSNYESFSGDRNFKTFEADFKSYTSKVSSSSAASATNLENHKDYKKSTARNEEHPPPCFDEELDVNSAAAAFRKAIEKAQESIRIAKESVGRKKGVKGFSSRSFKNSLKVKARVANVDAGEEQKEKDYKIKERDHKNGSTIVFPNFADGEKLFGAKKVVNEIHEKILESVKNSEIPIRFPFELSNNKMICNSKQVVGRTEAEPIENNTCEGPQKDTERPNGFLVLESCEKKLEDTESNNLAVCQKVETEKETSQKSDQNGYEKKLSEESFGLLENNMQENLEQEHDEDETQVKKDSGTESHSEEEKFYDVCEAESIKNAKTYACNIETYDSSQKEDFENHEAEESYENSLSDYDDAEENENVIRASNIVDCKVDQNDNNAESSQEIEDVSSSHTLEVEYKEAVEKEIFEDISSDEAEDKEAVEKERFESISSDETEDNTDECEAKSDNLENCGLADVDFGQDDIRFESSLDTIHGMEIEVKVYKEREATVEKEENNLHQSHEEQPEVRIEMDAGTPQEPKDACRESESIKVVHDKEERERERVKLAVERAIREARERAFAEVRQRVLSDTQEKVTKASIDKISAQSKLRAERALVERATAEARQRALEKAMKVTDPRTQVNETKQTSSTSQPNSESALRSKAKLEKHNRIMERAAKALAEKEKRDLLALKEQAERSRLAEYLDADIKRWSTGKEGNLRALLSTLQYILGADSGWQPLSLTEIITTNAVKKAYRKATLCVHPDKLQQRGASIQQKYTCEKVFDLLKAAWNRFNSEER